MAADTVVTLTIYEGSTTGSGDPAGALLLTQEFPSTPWELGTLQTVTLETPIEVVAGGISRRGASRTTRRPR